MNSCRPWLYLAPAGGLALVWIYLPLAGVGLLSTMRWNLTGDDRPFVGLDNYRRLVTGPEFSEAAGNTLWYALGLIPLVVVAPMACAILLWKHRGRAVGLYRTLLFLPVIIAPVVGAVIWQWILHPFLGVANAALGIAGMGPLRWLDEPSTALPAIVVVTSWKVFGLSFILYSAALANIDRSTIAAAAVDGATDWDVTRHIVIPQLTPTTALVSLLCLIFGGQWSFATINVLTGGGPQGATENVFSLLYTYGFRWFDTGAASATAVVIVAVFGALALAQVRIQRRWTRQQ